VVSLVALVVSWNNLRIVDSAARNDVIAHLRGWADQVVDLISEASELCRIEDAKLGYGELSVERSRLASRASSLLDRGRFFFPNVHRFPPNGSDRQAASGTHKPLAFHGLRPQILDMLMLCFDLIRKIELEGAVGDESRSDAFVHLRRVFVSAIQKATSSSATPRSLRAYEEYLQGIKVEPLPSEIRELAGATDRDFELSFRPDRVIDAPFERGHGRR
jgi:hypothetical protein